MKVKDKEIKNNNKKQKVLTQIQVEYTVLMIFNNHCHLIFTVRIKNWHFKIMKYYKVAEV